MRPTSLLLLSSLTILLLIILQSTEAKRPPPGKGLLLRSSSSKHPQHRRHPQRRPLFPPKKKFSLFGRRRRNPKKHPPMRDLSNEEQKNVYFYSLRGKGRRTTTERPRIILGDELNFQSLGIPLSSSSSVSTSPPITSIKSVIESSSNDNEEESYYSSQPNQYHRTPKKVPPPPPPPRGPGYRLKETTQQWQDHYVLDHQNSYKKNKRPPPPKVMDSMMRAAGELRNAYKAAIIQSAKVAKFTGNAASKYLKGVRNIFGGADAYDKKRKSSSSGDIDDGVLEIPSDSPYLLRHEEFELLPTPLASSSSSSSATSLVHLEWGSSFWKLFYKKANSGKIDKRVDENVNSDAAAVVVV